MTVENDEGQDSGQIAANQETDDLGSIKDFEGSVIDDPTTPHVQEKEDENLGETDEEKEARLAAETEDEDFEQQYEDIAKVWTRPTVKDLTTKYPNLFKNFPDLRTVMFREGKFTEIFPTLEDASAASEARETLDEIDRRVAVGDMEAIIEDIDKEALPKMASNFLPALYKKSANLYHQIMNPIIDRVLKAAYQEGDRSSNDNLKYGAAHLSKYIFGDESFASGEKTIPRLEFKEDKNLEDERAKFKIEKFTEARDSVVSYSTKRIEAEIKSGLPKDIPQRLQMIISEQVIEAIDKALNKDENHMAFMKRLWKQAEKSNFSGEHKARISSAFLARARNMIPKLRSTIVAELIGEPLPEEQEVRSGKRLMPTGSPSNNHRQQVTSKNVQYEKSDDLSIIKGLATFKGK